MRGTISTISTTRGTICRVRVRRRLAGAMVVALGLLAASGASTVGAREQESTKSPQALYEAGQYEQALAALGAQEPTAMAPDATYLAGLCYVRLERPADARAQFSRLAPGEEPAATPDPWRLVGQSAVASVDGDHERALEVAKRAVERAPDAFHPRYQLGLAHSALEQWEPAAEAFDTATTLDPSFAYAHYFAGLAYSKIKRVSRMATHFERFLQAAPEAPERPAVQALMRTVRGR